MQSVIEFAARVRESADRVDVLVLNAGVVALSVNRPTSEGLDPLYATNVLGHVLLFEKLKDLITKAQEESEVCDDCRRLRALKKPAVVVLTSLGHLTIDSPLDLDLIGPEDEQHAIPSIRTDLRTTWRRYAETKLACLHVAKYIAKHLPAVDAYAVHPGYVATNMATSLIKQSFLSCVPFADLVQHYFVKLVGKQVLDGAQVSLFSDEKNQSSLRPLCIASCRVKRDLAISINTAAARNRANSAGIQPNASGCMRFYSEYSPNGCIDFLFT